NLIERLGMHEGVAVVVLEQVVVVLLVEIGALDLVGGAVALGHLHAVGDAAHFEVRYRRALARMDALANGRGGSLGALIPFPASKAKVGRFRGTLLPSRPRDVLAGTDGLEKR